MLDINLFRPDKGGNPDVIRESQRKRYADEGLVDKVIELDAQWRQLHYEVEQLNKDLNAVSRGVATLKKAKQNDESNLEGLYQRSKSIKELISERRSQTNEVLLQRDHALATIGNIVHGSVPVSSDEVNNQVLREAGEHRPAEPWMRSHPDLLAMLGMADLEAGQAVAGGRGYYLLGQGVLLNQALVNYALQFLVARGFEPVQTPYFMSRDIMAECAQLSQFDDELYRVVLEEGKASPQHEDQRTEHPDVSSSEGGRGSDSDKYLIATSEQPLCALHRKGWFEAADLPLRYAGFSTCFRREVGSHGRDTLGIFRVHQFEKVEQFCITPPDGALSWQMMEEMMKHAEDFYASLGIPYRIVSLVSGALNKAAAMKYDLEGWFPAGQAHRELVSCSNCTDYQARRLDIRMRLHKGPGSPAAGAGSAGAAAPAPGSTHVHMLNSTLTATQRTMCCILENHQTREGVRVPEPLRPFMMGLDFIPFKRGLAGSLSRVLRK